MKIFHLIDSFDYGASAKQLKLLSSGFADSAITVEVCCLGPETPWLASLRQAGVIVHALGWTRWFDPSVVWNLRAILQNAAPDLIHVWRLPALRTLAVAAGDFLPRVVVSDPVSAGNKLTWWDRRLLEQVRCVTAASAVDRERCLQQGVGEAGLRVVSPLVEEVRRQERRDALTITCVGRLERSRGFREAIWAFDFVRFVYPEMRLEIIGSGTQRQALESLAAGLQVAERVHFTGACPNALETLGAAQLVWIPSLTNCGRQVALEAMAQGRAVIASDVPCLRELILDGVTGMLVPPGDVIQLARHTRILLEDATLRARLGAAAQEDVRTRFGMEQTLEAWRGVYRSLAA